MASVWLLSGRVKGSRLTIDSPKPGKANVTIPDEWLADFEAAARRPLALRLRYAFIHTHKPGLDEGTFRAFDTTAEYRDWCERHLPSWLGYGRV